MLCEVRSLGLSGISGYEVRAECDLSAGLPAFEIVGLPDAAVKEARDRVRAAIKKLRLHLPGVPHHGQPGSRQPAQGGHGVRFAHSGGYSGRRGQLRLDGPDSAYVGELSLSGSLRPVVGMLPMALAGGRASSGPSPPPPPPRPLWPAGWRSTRWRAWGSWRPI